jgi:hypothetical protein
VSRAGRGAVVLRRPCGAVPARVRAEGRGQVSASPSPAWVTTARPPGECFQTSRIPGRHRQGRTSTPRSVRSRHRLRCRAWLASPLSSLRPACRIPRTEPSPSLEVPYPGPRSRNLGNWRSWGRVVLGRPCGLRPDFSSSWPRPDCGGGWDTAGRHRLAPLRGMKKKPAVLSRLDRQQCMLICRTFSTRHRHS